MRAGCGLGAQRAARLSWRANGAARHDLQSVPADPRSGAGRTATHRDRDAGGDRLTYADLDERCVASPPASGVWASAAAIGSRSRSRRASRTCCFTSPGPAAAARSTCRSTPPTRSLGFDYFFGDAEPALIVCDPARRDAIGFQQRQLAPARDSERRRPRRAGPRSRRGGRAVHRLVPVADDDLAALLYTSAMTGRAKGAMLTHRNLASNALTLVEAGLGADDVLLHAAFYHYVHGLFVACNTALLAGARLLFLPRFDAAQVLEMLPRATVMMGVPTYYTCPPRGGWPFWRRAAPASACSSPAWRRCSRTPCTKTGRGQRILERYGMTETGDERIQSAPYEWRPGTVGLALPGANSGRGRRRRRARRARSACSRYAGRTCSRATGACPRRPRRSFGRRLLHHRRSRADRR